MCGIAGIVSADPSEVSLPRLQRMTDAIAHRGPEGEGHWVDAAGRVGFGHRRLAVIDLTDAGRQPMHYGDGRYTIIFNGEIYNYLELRTVLQTKGYRFRSESDTEVLVAMYDWKGTACLSELDGMFAFAIHDAKENGLFCARDRFGEKPFYYTYEPGRCFLFGSEMKALWAGGQNRSVNHSMLFNYLAHGLVQNVNDPGETFYEGIRGLENGHYLWLDTRTIQLEKKKYWDIDPIPSKDALPEREAAERFRELLTASVDRRLRADVPVGSSLSGGLDSSLIVSLAASRGRRMHTFSARFPGFARDEGAYMQLAADRAGADPVYVYPTGKDLPGRITEIFHYQEEPFGSASILAQYDVMRAAKDKGVTVLLDGQGADEVLGGYRRYYPPFIREMRSGHRREAGAAARAFIANDNHVNFGLIAPIAHIISNDFPSLLRLLKTGRVAARQTFSPLFQRDFFHAYHRRSHLPGPLLNERTESLGKMLYYDAYRGALSELLRYADRNAMAHSREIRLPFLDHELVSFLFQLPSDYKIRNGWSKYLMRAAFDSVLPREIAWRTDKIGYEPPQQEWMAQDAVKTAVREAGMVLIREGIVQKNWLDRKSGRGNAYRGEDWSFLMAAAIFS